MGDGSTTDETGTSASESAEGRERTERKRDSTSSESETSESTASPSETEEMSESAGEVLANARRAHLYHKCREGFFDSCHRWSMFLVLVTSSGAVLTLIEGSQLAGKILALIPAVIGAADMAMGFSQRARDHSVLARRCSEVAGAVMRGRTPIGDLDSQLEGIAADEPAAYEALQAFCHNQMCSAWDQPWKKQEIPSLHLLLRHLWRFSGREYPVVGKPPEGQAA